MSRIFVCIMFVFACFASAATAQVAAPTEEQKEIAGEKLSAAIDAAKSWLAIVDAGSYRDSWKEAAQYFKDKVPENQWETSLRQIRPPFGKAVSREVSNVQYTTYLPGAPIGEYAIIQFKVKFEDREAVETITPMLEKDGVWRVSGYYIR